MVVLLDTGYILALRNKDDNNLTKAKNTFGNDILTGKYGKILITDYVVDEIMTLILNRIKKKLFVEKTRDFLLKTTKIILLLIDEELFTETLNKYFSYFEQGLSFTDCTFLSLADKFQNQNFYIATFDRNLGKQLVNVV